MHLLDTNLKINCFFTATTPNTTITTTTTTTATTTTTTTSKKFYNYIWPIYTQICWRSMKLRCSLMHLLDTNLKNNCFFTATTPNTTTTTTTTTTATTTTTTTSKKFYNYIWPIYNIYTNMLTKYDIKVIIDALTWY